MGNKTFVAVHGQETAIIFLNSKKVLIQDVLEFPLSTTPSTASVITIVSMGVGSSVTQN